MPEIFLDYSDYSKGNYGFRNDVFRYGNGKR